MKCLGRQAGASTPSLPSTLRKSKRNAPRSAYWGTGRLGSGSIPLPLASLVVPVHLIVAVLGWSGGRRWYRASLPNLHSTMHSTGCAKIRAKVHGEGRGRRSPARRCKRVRDINCRNLGGRGFVRERIEPSPFQGLGPIFPSVGIERVYRIGRS